METLDLYLLHWRGRFRLEDTLEGFQTLQQQGKIRTWGVSNFDVTDMEELRALQGGDVCATDQVLYNPEYRGIEFDLLPWSTDHAMPLMAYSPVGQGGSLLRSATLGSIAAEHGATPAQVALAWCLRYPVLAIPKAGTVQHVEENAAATGLQLTPENLNAIDKTYPAPTQKQPLGVL